MQLKPTMPGLPTLGTRTLSRRVVVFVLLAAAIVILIGAATGERGYLAVRHREAARAELAEEVARLRADNAELMSKIEALRTDPYIIEKLAREKLGYARPGELIYLFPSETAPAP